MSAHSSARSSCDSRAPTAARRPSWPPAATPVHGRRLQEDSLLDTTRRRLAPPPVRASRPGGRRPESPDVQGTACSPLAMKVREELETVVGDGHLLLRLFEELGFRVWFRYQKYREEFVHGRLHRGRSTRRRLACSSRSRAARPASTAWREARAAAPTTTCWNRIEGCSSNTAGSAACRPATCCSTPTDADAVSRARAHRRSRHAPATADVGARQARLPVAGEPLVRRIIRWLAGQGVTDLVLNLHHLPHTLTAVVGDGRDLGVRVRYSWEQPVVLGSAGGPRQALPSSAHDTLLHRERRHADRRRRARTGGARTRDPAPW